MNLVFQKNTNTTHRNRTFPKNNCCKVLTALEPWTKPSIFLHCLKVNGEANYVSKIQWVSSFSLSVPELLHAGATRSWSARFPIVVILSIRPLQLPWVLVIKECFIPLFSLLSCIGMQTGSQFGTIICKTSVDHCNTI